MKYHDLGLLVVIVAFLLLFGLWVWPRLWKSWQARTRSKGAITRDEGFDGPSHPIDRTPPPRQGSVTGQVRGFRESAEVEYCNFYDNRSLIVWNFYLERYVGNERQMPIPVQMHGVAFTSPLENGDEVELHLGWWGLQPGATARPPVLTNLTSGALVVARTKRKFMEHVKAFENFMKFTVGCLFWLGVLSLVLWLLANPQAIERYRNAANVPTQQKGNSP